MFFLTQAALPHLKTGFGDHQHHLGDDLRGLDRLLDYSSTKGAILGFTRSLAKNLVKKGIRVNAVAPGPIWTPLNPSGGQPPEKIPEFGKDTPMGRPGQPNEVAPVLPVPRLRGFQLHDGPGAPSRRRQHNLELTVIGRYNCSVCPIRTPMRATEAGWEFSQLGRLSANSPWIARH